MRSLHIAGLAATLFAAAPVLADDLRPIQAYPLHLGSVTGTVYYDENGDQDHLVATMSVGEEATPVRFEASLAPGQSAMVSVPRGAGEPALDVRFVRRGDRVVVLEGDAVVGSIR